MLKTLKKLKALGCICRSTGKKRLKHQIPVDEKPTLPEYHLQEETLSKEAESDTLSKENETLSDEKDDVLAKEEARSVEEEEHSSPPKEETSKTLEDSVAPIPSSPTSSYDASSKSPLVIADTDEMSLAVESILTEEEEVVVQVNSSMPMPSMDDSDMPDDELLDWKSRKRTIVKEENKSRQSKVNSVVERKESPRQDTVTQKILEAQIETKDVPPPPPPLPPPPPPRPPTSSAASSERRKRTEVPYKEDKSRKGQAGRKNNRKVDVRNTKTQQTKNPSKNLSTPRDSKFAHVEKPHATNTKRKKEVAAIKPWYAMSSANVAEDKINVRPEYFKKSEEPEEIQSEAFSSSLSVESDPFSDLSSVPLDTETSSTEQTERKAQPLLPKAGLIRSRSASKIGDNTPSLVQEEISQSHKKARKEEEKLERFDGWASYRGTSTDNTLYGGSTSATYRVLGTFADDVECEPKILSPPIMENLQMFLPPVCAEDNFWLRYSLVRDGAGYETFLSRVRGATRSVLAIETTEGEVFGCFTSAPWRLHPDFFGTGEAFLWRLRTPRINASDKGGDKTRLDDLLEVYPFSGLDSDVQVCKRDKLALGGGHWRKGDCPFTGETGGFALCIHSDLQTGTSSTCATFANPGLSRLSKNGKVFTISNLEVWTFTPFSAVSEAEKSENRKLLSKGIKSFPLAVLLFKT